MGSTTSKQHKTRKNEIKKEFKAFQEYQSERVVTIFCGLSNCGKSTLINKVVSLYTDGQECNQSTYMMSKECKIKQVTYPKDESTLFKYLNYYYLLQHKTINGWVDHSLLSNSNAENSLENIDAFIVTGYIRQLQLQNAYQIKHLTKLIHKFYSIRIEIESIVFTKNSIELWEINDLFLETFEKLNQYINVMVFVLDLSVYDQVDENGKNKVDKALDEFDKIINSSFSDNFARILVLNKLDIFRKKMDQKILLNQCLLMRNCTGCTYNENMEIIKDELYQITGSSCLLFLHDVTWHDLWYKIWGDIEHVIAAWQEFANRK
eukprot:124503_1